LRKVSAGLQTSLTCEENFVLRVCKPKQFQIVTSLAIALIEAFCDCPLMVGCDIILAMIFYYIAPIYLTGIFLASYALVRFLLVIFDLLNFFWDWWDEKKHYFPVMGYAEFVILAAFVYYIVRWELSGTP